jgi:hypothetical protein
VRYKIKKKLLAGKVSFNLELKLRFGVGKMMKCRAMKIKKDIVAII